MVRLLMFLSICFLSLSGYTQAKEAELTEKVSSLTSKLPNGSQLSIAVIEDESVTFYGFIREEDTLKTIDNKSQIFEIGSISKVFTSVLLSDGISKGELRSEMKVDELLGFPLYNDSKVSLNSLSNHTSGIPRLPANFFASMMANSNNPYQSYPESELVDYLKNKIIIQPNVKGTYLYSNAGAAILAYAICESNSKTYQQMLEEVILSPLGMNNTKVEVNDSLMVKGLDADGKEVENWDFGSMYGAGALNSNVQDLALFVLANLDPNYKVLNRVREKTFEVSDELSLGMAWHIFKDSSGEEIYFHDGGTGGYTSAMALQTGSKKGVVILSNISPSNPESAIVTELCFVMLK